MNYEKENYVGKNVFLYPNDTYKKHAYIYRIDDLGFEFRITKADSGSGYKEGDRLFISHNDNLKFIIED